MAMNTNCINNYDHLKKDLYTDFINSLRDELIKLKKNELVVNILKIYDTLFDRKFSKLLIMPTFYNMGTPGIKNLLIKTLKDLNYNQVNDKKALEYLKINFKAFLSLIIKILSETLVSNYTHTIKYQKYLVDICKILFKSDNSINIKTLDGCYITYRYLKRIDTYCSIYINNKKTTHRIFLPIYDRNKNVLSEQHYITFPPNWIHSIDASICRTIVHIYYQFFNEILEPLHDSFRVIINNLNCLKIIIKYVYLFYFFNDYFHKNKLGICFINQKITLEFNSLHYINYKNYLPYDEKYIDVFQYTFQSNFNTNKDTEIEIKNNTYFKKTNFTDEEILLFINNKYMFTT